MKHVKYKPELSEWKLEAAEGIFRSVEKAIHRAAGEALHYAFESDNSYLYFPVEWGDSDGIGGPVVEDPLTIYLRVGLEGDGEKPTFEFNLRDALADTIEACKEDGSFSPGLGRLSDALRDLAAYIDAAREKSNANSAPDRGR